MAYALLAHKWHTLAHGSNNHTVPQEGGGAEKIKFGGTLSNGQLADKCFDHMTTNPPYGKEWKKDKDGVEREAERGYPGRIGAGTPRIILPYVVGIKIIYSDHGTFTGYFPS